MASEPISVERDLHEAMQHFALWPDEFVRTLYRWPVHGESGPDLWQAELLHEVGRQVRERRFNGCDPVLPLRFAISKGHGVGGSTLVAWLAHWIMSTRPYCHGTVTANTNDQLEKKTWAAIREWHQHLLHKHWFEINARRMWRVGYPATWFVAPASCAEENSEAFAGQHAKDSTSFYLNDEDSAVPDKIHEVEEGGLTDGEPMQFLFANPTRNTGAFYRAAFGSARERYTVRIIDSRTSKFANKDLIQQWIDDFGLESDFVRVRVRGLPPLSDALQFIDAGRIAQAGLNVVQPIAGDPLILGVDVSGGGAAMTVGIFRRGFDARSIQPIVLTGEQTTAHDRQLAVSKLAAAIDEHHPNAVFIDAAFGAPIVVRLRQLGYTMCHEINFGAPSPDAHYANQRAMQWARVKDWLVHGCIDQHDVRLAADLAAPGFHLNKAGKLVIESKESMQRRGIGAVDRADALSLTFAQPVSSGAMRRQPRWGPVSASWAGA